MDIDFDEDEDTHYCLSCQSTIVGLDNYIIHRKSQCPSRKRAKVKSKAQDEQIEKTKPSQSEQYVEVPLEHMYQSSEPFANIEFTMGSIEGQQNEGSSHSGDVQYNSNLATIQSHLNVSEHRKSNDGTEKSLESTSDSPPPKVTIKSEKLDEVQSTPRLPSLQVTTSSAANTSITDLGPEQGILSPRTARLIDTNLVLDPQPQDIEQHHASIVEFLQTLELQAVDQSDTTKHGQDQKGEKDFTKADHDENDDDRNLKIANILNDFEFSSDSDDLPSDVDDLLDYADDDYHQPASRSGGQWGPSGKLAGKLAGHAEHHGGKGGKYGGKYGGKGRFSHHSPGKNKHGGKIMHGGKMSGKLKSHARHSTGGKWKPEERPEGGKYSRHIEREYEEQDEEEEEQENDPQETTEEPVCDEIIKKEVAQKEHEEEIKEKPSVFLCKICSRNYPTQESYYRHCKTRFHKMRLEKKKDTKRTERHACPICKKEFNQRNNFARHLMSRYHTKRVKGKEMPTLLDESMQALLLQLSPYQCKVCRFYCNNAEVFQNHLDTLCHVEKCQTLMGPLLCLRCKYEEGNCDAMTQHFQTAAHIRMVEGSSRPCILKEKRTDIPCPNCNKVFHSATKLELHLDEDHPSEDAQFVRHFKRKGVHMRVQCNICLKQWPTFHALNVHMRRKHSTERPFHCEYCNTSYADKYSLKNHEQTKGHVDRLVEKSIINEADAQYKTKPLKKKQMNSDDLKGRCKDCDYIASSYGSLLEHYRESHPDKLHNCYHCSYSTHVLAKYDKHLATTYHKQRSKGELKKDKLLECCKCLTTFSSENTLKLHMITHEATMTENQLIEAHDGDECVGIAPEHHDFVLRMKEDVKNKLKKESHSQVECPQCKLKVFPVNMLTHLRVHNNALPFKCPVCNEGFRCGSTLRKHILNTHVEPHTVACEYCDRSFSRRPTLLKHQQNEHKGVAKVATPFTCDICGESFSFNFQLNQHIKIRHTTAMEFHCDFEGCGKKFVYKSQLENHERLHTGEKPFLCDSCGYSARNKQLLIRHRRIHTGERAYSCRYCDYKAVNSTHVRRHMRIHIGSKPYKCPYCNYACNTHENIRKHILKTKRHAGKMCYPCKQCDFGTNSAHEFKRHMNDEHGVDLEDNDVSSVLAGLYAKDEDKRDVDEGEMVIPRKDRVKRSPLPEKPKKKKKQKKGEVHYTDLPIQIKMITPDGESDEDTTELIIVNPKREDEDDDTDGDVKDIITVVTSAEAREYSPSVISQGQSTQVQQTFEIEPINLKMKGQHSSIIQSTSSKTVIIDSRSFPMMNRTTVASSSSSEIPVLHQFGLPIMQGGGSIIAPQKIDSSKMKYIGDTTLVVPVMGTTSDGSQGATQYIIQASDIEHAMGIHSGRQAASPTKHAASFQPEYQLMP